LVATLLRPPLDGFALGLGGVRVRALNRGDDRP
jgi:hypothetical protein